MTTRKLVLFILMIIACVAWSWFIGTIIPFPYSMLASIMGSFGIACIFMAIAHE